jgi:hypothetical protein
MGLKAASADSVKALKKNTGENAEDFGIATLRTI